MDTEKYYSAYSCQALRVQCGHALLFVVQSIGPASNRKATFVILFLEEYTYDTFSTNSVIGCVQAYGSR